jgi:hypothetical protein
MVLLNLRAARVTDLEPDRLLFETLQNLSWEERLETAVANVLIQHQNII